jgi:hypothetical protein
LSNGSRGGNFWHFRAYKTAAVYKQRSAQRRGALQLLAAKAAAAAKVRRRRMASK